MARTRLPDPQIRVNGRGVRASSYLAYAGAYQLTLSTIVAELALELHSSYLGHPDAPQSYATHLELAPGRAPDTSAPGTRAGPTPPPVLAGLLGHGKARQGVRGALSAPQLQTGPAGTQARAFLENAGKTPGDLAGRMVALAVMARYANEDAVAQSSRSFSEIEGGDGLPWSIDTVEIIDEIAAERLPAHLLDPGREGREQQAAHRRQVREDRTWLAEQLDALETMDPDQRAQVLAEATQRFGEYSGHAWRLKERIRDLDAAQQANESDAEPEGGDA